jgi:hypothetical protein
VCVRTLQALRHAKTDEARDSALPLDPPRINVQKEAWPRLVAIVSSFNAFKSWIWDPNITYVYMIDARETSNMATSTAYA